MKTCITIASLISILALATAARAAETEDAVKKCVNDFTDAWNQHDAKKMAAHWAEDGDVINPFGRVAKGRAEVEQLFSDEQQGVMKDTTHQMTVTSVRKLGDDAAVVDCDSVITGMTGRDGNAMPPFKLHVLLVVTMKDGQSQIIAARPYVIPHPPQQNRPAGEKSPSANQ